MQLNKYIAQAGICSRRKAVELIKQGVVTVNGQKVTEPGYQVKSADIVRVRGKKVARQKLMYILMNKPKDYVTTVSDERGRRTVIDLLSGQIKERVYPVGRLDRSTTGLLLLTNDGELAEKLAHPRYEVKKVYHVLLDKPLVYADMQKIKAGVRLSDGLVRVDMISYAPGKYKNHLRVTLHSGKYRIVRRMFEHFDYDVIQLDRVRYAGLTKKGLRVGMWRYLTAYEIRTVKQEGSAS